MKYNNVEELKSYITMTGQIPEFIFFSGGVFSQWYIEEFKVDDVLYNCAEQYMMAQKALLFEDIETYQKIMESDNPRTQKWLGRQVKSFDKEIWEKHDFSIVVKGNTAKFTHIDYLKRGIIRTDNKVLVEATMDQIWGIGMRDWNHSKKNPEKWKGLNKLGFALMQARENILTGGL